MTRACVSPEANRKRSQSLKGHVVSEETRRKISMAKIGTFRTEEQRQKMSDAKKGRTSNAFGKRWKLSEETKQKMSISKMGSKAPAWKGGITPINFVIRSSREYRMWRESVFSRDGWTCVICKKKGGVLHADHIKSFALFPEFRFSIENGRTLCKPCHLKTETYGFRKANSQKKS